MIALRTACVVIVLAGSACANSAAPLTRQSASCIAPDELIAKIDGLDPQAIRAGFNSLKCYDGAEIEDVYRSLGVAFAAKPGLVVEQMQRTQVEARHAAPMLTMLPLSFVDDTCGSLGELGRRKVLIQNASLPDETKQIFLSSVQRSIERDSAHCTD